MSTMPASQPLLSPGPSPAVAAAPALTTEPPLDDFPYPPPDSELDSEDGENLESDWHRKEINLLLDQILQFRLGRTDYYAGGNMFIFFSEAQVRDRDYRGPDFFFVDQVDGTRMREWWATWSEGGRTPDVVIELNSPRTKKEDLGTKKHIYEKVLRVPDYYCYDPRKEELLGWRLSGTTYEPLKADANGRLDCQSLGLKLGLWRGTFQGFEAIWLRFFDQDGQVIPTPAEAEHRRAEAAQAEATTAKAEATAAKAEAQAETQRADRLEQELARLKAKFGEK